MQSAALSVRSEGLSIVIEGDTQMTVRVFDINGRLLYSGSGAATVPVACRGIYIVEAASRAFKLAI